MRFSCLKNEIFCNNFNTICQESLCSSKEMECVESVVIDHFSCLKPCSGLIVTSFSKNNFKKKLEDIQTISKAYNDYKKITEYPSGYAGKDISYYDVIIYSYDLDFEWKNNMRFVRIYFDTPTFDRITKDRAAKFVDMLSAIGGTMGLLTGFSIISGVEILYFVAKIIWNSVEKKRK